MWLFSALILIFIVAGLILTAAVLASPMIFGVVVIAVVNLLGFINGFGIAPIIWDIYTIVTAIRGVLMICGNALFDEAVNIQSLKREYLIVSAIVFGLWIIREVYRNRKSIVRLYARIQRA